MSKKRVLTGDRPTGKLHLGHLVGSIVNRVRLQDEYDCFFIIADLHTLTTKPSKQDILGLREHVYEMVVDYLACGIDPKKSTIYLQSACPAVYEMNLLFEMMISLNRLVGLPSLKEMAKNAHIDMESVSFGLVGYPVLQAADILMPRAHLVPVGRDNEAHVELCRDIARKFNALYGEVLTLPEVLLGETPSLVGIDGQGKMSKSAGNAIFLSDDEQQIVNKVNKMFTDPKRVRADIPGEVENNPVFIYHDLFNDNKEEVISLKQRYRAGRIGDVEVKQKLVEALQCFLKPIREERRYIEKEKGLVEEVIFKGTKQMREISEETVKDMKSAMGISGLWSKIVRIAEERRRDVSSIF